MTSPTVTIGSNVTSALVVTPRPDIDLPSVSIGSCAVLKPLGLSAARAAAAATAATTTPAASATATLVFLLMFPSSCGGSYRTRCRNGPLPAERAEKTVEQEARIAARGTPGVLLPSDHELVGAAQQPQAPLGDELLVDGAEPTCERRVNGRAEGDGLAVHRSAGGHHEVRERDEALRIDGPFGHDETGQSKGADRRALLRRAREDDGPDVGIRAEALEHL